MNLNYSYRAFVITCLLFGILFLAFKSIKLSRYVVVVEESFDVEYSKDDLELEEELASMSRNDAQIETNRAFNEAEKFISEIENEREVEAEAENLKTDANETEVSESGLQETKHDNSHSEEKLTESEAKEVTSSNSEKLSSKKNSTVSYRLLDRRSMYLPNPVYTCAGYGKVVISIEVSATGKVLKAKFNSAKSTTSNQCLIDNALTYAKVARFSTSSGRPKQMGSITYNFPGQQ